MLTNRWDESKKFQFLVSPANRSDSGGRRIETHTDIQ